MNIIKWLKNKLKRKKNKLKRKKKKVIDKSLPLRDQVLSAMLYMSDQAVDPLAKEQMRNIFGKCDEEVREPLIRLINDCVFASLTSGFELMVLNHLYTEAGGNGQRRNQRELKNMMLS